MLRNKPIVSKIHYILFGQTQQPTEDRTLNILVFLTNRLAPYGPVIIKSTEPFLVHLTICDIDQSFPLETRNTLILCEKCDLSVLNQIDSSNCILFLGKTKIDGNQCQASLLRLTKKGTGKKLEKDLQLLLADLLVIYQTKNTFYNIYTRNYELTALVNYAEELIQNPISVFNLTSEPIAMGKQFAAHMQQDAIVKEYKQKGFISLDFAQNHSFNDFFSALHSAKTPFTFYHKEKDILGRRIYPIISDGKSIAHCTVILKNKITPITDAIIQYLCDLAAFGLQRNPYSITYSSRDAVILKQLLSGKYNSNEEFAYAVDYADFKSIQTLYIFTIHTDSKCAMTDPGMLIRELFQMLVPDTKWIKHLLEPNRLVFLINTDTTQFLFKNEKRIKDYFKRTGYLCAASQPFSDMSVFQSQYLQTENLLDIAKYLGQTTGLLHGYRMFFSRIAYDLREHDLDNYCLFQLLYLERTYPHAETLLLTVRAFIEEGLSIQKTADKLATHRNTIQRRLERFQELTQLSLESGRTICQIYLSLTFMEFKRRKNIEHFPIDDDNDNP